MFMKVFLNAIEAQSFAAARGGKVTISYSWNEQTHSIIREYVVKF